MDVLLVGAELEENLALRYLGAALRASGHAPRYARFDNPGDTASVVEAVNAARPGLVGLSMTFQYRAKEFGVLAEALRSSGFRGHITGGGHFPTFAFKEALESFPAIDSIVRHEGERTIVELCAALAKTAPGFSDIEGLAWRRGADVVCNAPRGLEMDLDGLPFPERFGEPQLHLGVPAAFMVGTRGCFGHCTFCCIHAYLKAAGGPMYRMRSPANVAEEMRELREKRGARMFVFHDDDCDELRARRVRDVALVVKARPDDVEERVFDVLEDIGLLRVYLGIEAGSTQGLRTLGRGVALTENRRALDYLRRKNIYTCFNMLVFDPESRLESLRESLRFLRDYTDVPMNFCRTEIYVGTPLMTKLSREGSLVGDVYGWDYVIRDPRAERAFRIFARAFLDRNFRCDGLMNSNLGLGYHLHLLRTFYPGAVTPRLRELADQTTRAVNLDCIARMEAIFDFAERSSEPAAIEDFSARMTAEVTRANVELEARVAEATSEIIRAAFAPARRRRDPLWRAAATAAMALGPLEACDRSGPPPPPDPLPIPTLMAPDAEMVVPNDPLPTPFDAGAPAVVKDAGRAPPPPDPLPPPTIHRPPPPDPLPPPTLRRPVPPPPDPLPPPHMNKP